MRRAALGVALATLLAGCALLDQEGDEALAVRNASAQPLSVILILTQDAGGVRILGEEVFLERGQEREFPLALRPGSHTLQVTTTHRVQETLVFSIPEKGDTRIELLVTNGGATLTTSSTG